MGKASRAKRETRASVKPISKERNWFPILTTGFVLAFVAIIAVVVLVGNAAGNAPAKAPASAAINQETGAISMGTGVTIVDEYLDFGCNHCKTWHSNSAAALSDLVERDLITLNIHPISILDNGFQGTEYSTRAAAAAYCVAEDNADAAYGFIDMLFKNQPFTGTPGLSDEQLVDYASKADAPGAESCITSGEYKPFVTEMTQNTPTLAASIQTPTILVNGEFVNPGDPVNDTIVSVAESAS